MAELIVPPWYTCTGCGVDQQTRDGRVRRHLRLTTNSMKVPCGGGGTQVPRSAYVDPDKWFEVQVRNVTYTATVGGGWSPVAVWYSWAKAREVAEAWPGRHVRVVACEVRAVVR